MLGDKTRAISCVIAALLLSGVAAHADEWPQWRGPQRDGVWRESGVVDSFEGDRIPLRWSAPVSNGYSGPTVANGRVYVTDRVKEPRSAERVHCFDRKTGEKIWSHRYPATYTDIDYRNGPRAAVLIDEGRAYSLGATGRLHCFDAASGKVLWRKNLRLRYDIQMPIWGIAASPLVEQGLLIVHIGATDGTYVAFDKNTGEKAWAALSDGANYNAPIVIDQAGRRVLVGLTAKRVVGLDPTTGELYWDHPFRPKKMPLAVPTPVRHRDYLFFTGFYDGSLLLKTRSDKMAVEEVWRRRGPSETKTDALHSIIATPYLMGDAIYGIDSYGEYRCLDLQTGDRIWTNKSVVPRARWATVHTVRQDDRFWLFNEKGELIIAHLSRDGYEEVDRAKLIEPTKGQLSRGVCWTHPAFAYKHVFVRNDKRLVCADLSADENR